MRIILQVLREMLHHKKAFRLIPLFRIATNRLRMELDKGGEREREREREKERYLETLLIHSL
jgi:hypothetical protein